jgi:predicted TIM-barrel fold metal-dependent hydrolase
MADNLNKRAFEFTTDGSVIDVHCHTFNARDLSVKGFLRNVLLNSDEILEKRFLDPLVDLLAALTYLAPKAKDELVKLRQGLIDELVAEETNPVTDDAFIMQLAEQLERLSTSTPSDRDLLNHIKSEVQSTTDVMVDGLDWLKLARLVAQAPGRIVHAIQWFYWILRSRTELTQRLISLYGGSDGQVMLFTPALVDYGLWLCNEPDTPIEQQIELNAELIRRFPGRIHPFAPFDPLRQIFTQGAALTWVKRAVEKQGFIGVKLYPPMGFRAWGNHEVAELQEADCGRHLDEALKSLYEWAQEKQVSLMAHCNMTNGNKASDAERASPLYWERAFEAFPDLTVNLGHFGGEGPRWSEMICQLMTKHRGVYADLGYTHGILDAQKRLETLDKIARLREQYPIVEERLLFGTDWIMVALEPGYPEYLKRFVDSFHGRFGETFARRFFAENARDYLGLKPGNGTYERLISFYVNAGLKPPPWLATSIQMPRQQAPKTTKR